MLENSDCLIYLSMPVYLPKNLIPIKLTGKLCFLVCLQI